MKPKLRAVRAHVVSHNGQRGVILEDPMHLNDRMIFVPQVLAPALALMDGTRDARDIQAALHRHAGILLPASVIERLIKGLDEALMLENERFIEAQNAALADYRQARYRVPSHAGDVYPWDPNQLTQSLEAYRQQVRHLPEPLPRPIRAVISPHIDYARGGSIYAGAWTYAAEASRAAERAIILGTDHNGDVGRITLTRQNYATPLGIVPTSQEIVDSLVEVLGPEDAFAEELHHRGEHSVELALVWLHHMRQGRPIEVVPILLGSFEHYIVHGEDPAEDERLNAVIDALRQAMSEKPTLVVAGADLAHVGPAFGDDKPWGPEEKARLRAVDEQLLESIRQGDPGRFFQAIAQVHDRYRVCGLAPIYMVLRLVEGAQGVVTGYDQCPADGENGSVVSICGAALG